MWSCVFLLQLRIEFQLHHYRDKNGKPNPKEADAVFWGRYLAAFGIQVSSYASPNKFWLVVLLTVIPAVVTMFLVFWFADPTFEYQCSEISGTAQVPTDAYCPKPNICCSVVSTVFSPIKFVTYLAGNLLSAYKIIQYAAKV